MRRKQLLALLMVGALTVSMAPSAAFAAVDNAELSIEEGSEGTDAAEGDFTTTPSEEGSEAAPTPEETPTETPEELPPETPEELPVETPEETPTEVPEGQTEAAPTVTPEATPTPEVKGNIMIGEQSYETLADAVAAIPDGAGDASQIIITGDIELSETVTIPAGKTVTIAAAGENTVISRASGFTGSLFQVDGGTFQLTTGTADNTDGTSVTGSLSVDGSTEDGSQVDGTIVEITSGNFGLSSGVTLTGNNTTGNGGAVRNTSGTLYLLGGTITGNQAAQGGAVYSEGNVSVQGTVTVTGNIKTEGLEENNITLNGEAAVINATGALTGSNLSFDVLDPAEGRQVVTVSAEGVTLADVLTQVTYNGDDTFIIDEEGKLKSTQVSPTPTPETTPLKLTAVSMGWTGYDSLKVVCNSNKDGKYYVAWVKKGAEAPSFDSDKKDGEVVADYNFTAYITDLPKEEVDIYVCVQDNDGKHKAMLFQPNYKKRPAAPVTPTPDHVPVVPKVTDSIVQGLENPLEFYPNTFYNFTVIGAGTENKKPGTGDVKWIPLYWSTSSNPDTNQRHTTWKIGTQSGIKDAATYNLFVFFQKAIFDGTNWQMTDTIESATYQFKSKQITIATPTPTTDAYGGNGESGNGYNGDGYDDPTDYSDDADGETSKAAVATSDETPVGNMLMLAAASLLAGGYVLIRRRKKEIE